MLHKPRKTSHRQPKAARDATKPGIAPGGSMCQDGLHLETPWERSVGTQPAAPRETGTGLQSSTSPRGQCLSQGTGEQSGWSARGVLLGHEKDATAWTSLENAVSERRRTCSGPTAIPSSELFRSTHVQRRSRGAGGRNCAGVWTF